LRAYFPDDMPAAEVGDRSERSLQLSYELIAGSHRPVMPPSLQT